jgi:hypothetical protein
MNFRLKYRHYPIVFFTSLIVILTAFSINQSSVGIYGDVHNGSGIFGADRPIRSDEWLVRLPWLLNQDAHNFPTEMDTTGKHDVGIAYDLPSKSADVLVRPHVLPYLLLDFERALAAEWWILVIGCAIAMYTFLLTLGIRPGLSLPLSIVVAASPGLHWWNVTSTFSIILYGCFAGAAYITSLRQTNPRFRILFALISGWLFACAIFVLYPPLQIPVLGVVGLLLINEVITNLRLSFKRQTVTTFVAAILPFLLIVGLFLFRHRSGLSAMSNTIYPGARRSTGGGVNISSLFGTPFDTKASSIVAGSVNNTNQSENSSTFLFALPILFFIPFSISRDTDSKYLRQFWISVGCFTAFLMWMLLPIPQIVGKITLFDLIPPDRIKPPIVFVSTVLAALFFEHFLKDVPRRRRVVGVLTFFIVTVWAGSHYLVNEVQISKESIWFYSLLWLIPVMIAFFFAPRIGIWLVATLSLFTSLNINPIHNSVKAVTNSVITTSIKELDPGLDYEWMSFSGSAQIRGLMVASGAKVISSVSPYPDKDFWQAFDTNSEFEAVWNRYGHVVMSLTTGPTKISTTQDDVISIATNPCDPLSPIDDGSFFIESSPTSIACAKVEKTFSYQGADWFILRKR